MTQRFFIKIGRHLKGNVSFVLLLIVIACGKDGSGNGGQPAKLVEEAPIVEPTELTALMGVIYVDDTEHPAANYIVRLLDHTSLYSEEQILGSDGQFSFPLSKFIARNIYSLELLTNNRIRVGDFDFLPDVTGGQGGFSYSTDGSGADIGATTIVTDGFGLVNVQETTLTGTLDGGFSVAEGKYSGTDLLLPTGIASAFLGSTLHPSSTNQMLESFCRNGTYPRKYHQTLDEISRIAVGVRGKGVAKMMGVRIANGPSWIENVQKISADSGLPELWSISNFEVPMVNTYFAEAYVEPGRVVEEGSSLTIEIQTKESPPIYLHRTLANIIVMPPIIESITINSALERTIDYEDSTAENGLSRPFTWSSDQVQLTIHMPKTSSGRILHADVLSKLTLELSFYSVDSAGNLVVELIKGADYPQAFSRSGLVGSEDNIKRYWDPSGSLMKYVISDAHTKSLNRLNLRIDSGILLLGTKKIVRVKAVIRMAGDLDETSTFFWLKK